MVAGLAVAGLFACADTENSGVMSRETPMANPMTNPMDNPTPDAGTQMANPDSGVAVMNPMDAGTVPPPMGRDADAQRAYEQ